MHITTNLSPIIARILQSEAFKKRIAEAYREKLLNEALKDKSPEIAQAVRERMK